MGIEKTLNQIREQSKDDFKYRMLALENVNGHLNTMVASVMKELGIVRARMASQEERFEAMLDAVQGELKKRAQTC